MVGVQDRDYNCGIFAAMYLLERYFGWTTFDPRVLETIAHTTPENGTCHEGIINLFASVLESYKLTFRYNASIADLGNNLPAIVNCQHDGEGHYIVVNSIDPATGGLEIWDPADGHEHLIVNPEEWADKNWYSNLYGARWFLTVRKD